MPIIDLNNIQLDTGPDYNNPQVVANTMLDLYGEQPSAPSGQIVDLSTIKLDQPAPPENTFSSRLQADFAKRKDAMNQSAEEYVSGNQGLGSTYLQTAGNIAAVPFDAAIETVKSGYSALPDAIKPRLTEGGRAVLDTVKQGIGSAANYVSDSAVGDVARQYAEENPVAMKNAAAIGNIASIVPLGAAAKIVGKPVVELAGKGLVKGADAVASGVEKLAVPKQILPSSEQLSEMGVKAYDAARASGEVFDNTVSSGFVSAIEKAKPAKIAGAVETDLSQALESGLGKYREIAGKPLSIDEIDIIDKDLSNLKDQAYNSGKNQLGSELANIQNSLRGSVADAPSGQALAEGRDFFRRKYQMEDVERIFRNAEGRPNEAAIIQTGYRNLANQARKKGSGYSKEQIGLMDEAAKGGLSIDALKLMSSKLIPAVAGASGNFAGAGVAYMGNLAAGAGATALQTAKANKLAKSIVGDIRVQGEPTLVNRLASKINGNKLIIPDDAIQPSPIQSPQVSPTAQGLAKSQLDDAFIAKKSIAGQNKGFAESGKPTSLYTFIKKNGGLKDPQGDIKSMGYTDIVNDKGMNIDSLGEKLYEAGFFNERPTVNQVLNLISDNNGGRLAYAAKDLDRVMKAQDKAALKGMNDPTYVEFSAYGMGIETEGKTTEQLLKEIGQKMRQQEQMQNESDIPF